MPEFTPAPVTDPTAHDLLSEYFHSRELSFVGGTYAISFPSPEQFVPPAGIFVVVRDGDHAVGCGGIRRLAPHQYEVKHLYLRPETRGKGWGRQLLADLERRAAEFGATEVVLDTNATLTAAGGLYQSMGYESVEPYNDNPNANAWYRKELAG
ncbi:GNAT family N-acetyltransferase [Mycetocola sp. 2940]|uniref:GNAT family N-acetyltransferase n=1 Tax=Mycetocola sp. 2940 TaxID=3156452 RepID=UPI003398B133